MGEEMGSGGLRRIWKIIGSPEIFSDLRSIVLIPCLFFSVH